MNRGAWGKPVVLELYGRPGTVTIADTLDAALFLLGTWQGKRTDTHMAAVMSCRDTLTGKAVPSLARAMFIDAALDAGYHIQPETFLNEHWEPMAGPVSDLRPGFGLEGHNTQAAGRPSAGRWSDSPVITRMPSPAKIPEPERAGMLDLLGRLGEVVGLIIIEMVRGVAGLMNIGVRRGPSKGVR